MITSYFTISVHYINFNQLVVHNQNTNLDLVPSKVALAQYEIIKDAKSIPQLEHFFCSSNNEGLTFFVLIIKIKLYIKSYVL